MTEPPKLNLEHRANKFISNLPKNNVRESRDRVEKLCRQLTRSHTGNQTKGKEREFIESLLPMDALRYATILAAGFYARGVSDCGKRLVQQYKSKFTSDNNELIAFNNHYLPSEISLVLTDYLNKGVLYVKKRKFSHGNYEEARYEIYLDGERKDTITRSNRSAATAPKPL